MMIVAHRGASRYAPENTLPAFRLAWEQGADAIEGDFRLTRDGHVVCLHDATTGRTAGADLVVARSTLADLRRLDVGAWRGETFRGTGIPTLAEVLATIPGGKGIYIELKCGEEIIAPLLAEIGTSGLAPRQIVVISFDHRLLRVFKAGAPQYRTYWLSGFRRAGSETFSPSLPAILKTLRDIRADGFSGAREMADARVVRGVIDSGYEYHVWTVDDPQSARRFAEWGVRSITTNVPGRM